MIEGLAVLYGVRGAVEQDGETVFETIAPDAFKVSVQCLMEGRYSIPLTINHDHARVIATTPKLLLRNEPAGVRFRLPNFHVPQNFNGLSFTFCDVQYRRSGNESLVTRGLLSEISLCVNHFSPVYPETRDTVRFLLDPVRPIDGN
jgi:hypothetical protein